MRGAARAFSIEMSMKCGIVGSTQRQQSLQRADQGGRGAETSFLHRSQCRASSKCPDKRREKLTEIVKPQRVVPAVTEFVSHCRLVAGRRRRAGAGQPVSWPISAKPDAPSCTSCAALPMTM